jgi:eukaryotic-like serine/threonine-protein kinase
MAEVHLARQRGPRSFEKIVVVKTVRPALASRPELANMLLDEARIAALVKHPNVVDIYDLGEEAGTFFIAMEYLEGESLAQILKQAVRGQRLDPFSTARIIADCAAGLHAAHELRSLAGEPLELVHQDVTPGNVIVLYTGQTKLVDFGVARVRTSADDGMIKGKTGYLAPELLDGAPADRRSDVWSLGVVLWEALTMRRLFAAKTEEEQIVKIRAAEVPPPSSLMSSVPRDLDDVVAMALSRDPSKRYRSALAMQTELMQILRHASWAGGYDPIGRFMKSAFADRITARRELLKELATTKGPRRDTLERLDAITEEPSPLEDGVVVGSHGTGSRPRRQSVLPLPAPPPGDETGRGWPHAQVEVLDVVDDDDSPTGVGSEPGERSEEIAIEVEAGEAPAPVSAAPTVKTSGLRRRGAMVGAVLAAALVGLGIAAAVTGGGGSRAAAIDAGTAGTVAQAPVEADAAVAVVVDAAPEPEPAVVIETPDPPGEIDVKPKARRDKEREHEKEREKERVPDRPPVLTGGTAKSLYKDGLQRFVSGDTKAAIDLFEASIGKSKGYAPAYRGLGMAYEKRGEKRRALRAFETYLRLAPDASDADTIRKRMEKLR